MSETQGNEGVVGDAARLLAEVVLSMNMVTPKGLVARSLARKILGIDDHGSAPDVVPITTNDTTRLVPRGEPVFLIRAQDVVGADTVRAWVALAEAHGAAPTMLEAALRQAGRMDAWATKKIPDLLTG